MADYTVGPGGDFSSLTAAARQVVSGDTVNVLDGVYRELLVCRVPGVTWRAAEGHRPVIDGGWNGGRVDELVNQVAASAPGVTVRGFTIQNSPGRGVSISASDVTIENCRIDNCSNAGISANGKTAAGISGLVVRGNILTRLGGGRLVGDRANGAMIFVRVMDSVIAGNVIRGGHGEGINVDKGSYRILVEGNHVENCAHVYIYMNRCTDCEVRGNTMYNGRDETYHHSEGWPAGIICGDEREGGPGFPWQSGNRIVGNLVVGTGKLFQVRNNLKDPGGYDTQLLGHVVAGNTFVAGPGTEIGVEIMENLRGRPHRDSVFRDNVVYGQVPSSCNAPGVAFLNNGWTVTPKRSMASDGDVYGDLMLSAPDAAGFAADNYRPRVGSPLIGAASDGTTIGALEPAGDVEPPPVDPPLPDYEWVIAALEGNLEKLEAAGLAIGAAVIDTHELIDLLKSAAG